MLIENGKLKIYLDQKDYSSIARGLNGETGYEKFPAIFDYLLHLVESGKISIYLSSFHILESLRYENLQSELWAYHCDVIDKLTQGNCIIFFKELEKFELEIFLSDHFDFQTELIKENYPYGKYQDAVRLGDFSKISIKLDSQKFYVLRTQEPSGKKTDITLYLKVKMHFLLPDIHW